MPRTARPAPPPFSPPRGPPVRPAVGPSAPLLGAGRAAARGGRGAARGGGRRGGAGYNPPHGCRRAGLPSIAHGSRRAGASIPRTYCWGARCWPLRGAGAAGRGGLYPSRMEAGGRGFHPPAAEGLEGWAGRRAAGLMAARCLPLRGAGRRGGGPQCLQK